MAQRQRRNKQVPVMVTDAEHKWLHREAKRAGLSVGEYLRARAGLKTSSPVSVAAAYSTQSADANVLASRVAGLSQALAGLQDGIDNARALLEGEQEERNDGADED